jgi:membrane protein DedA with SNARE-associated domain
VGLYEDFIGLVAWAYHNPVAYLPITFGFSVLVAIVLPVPIEIVLLAPLLEQQWGYLGAIILVMAAGKTVGAWLIFYLGVRVEDNIRRWSDRYKLAARLVKWCERFVRKTNYIGLYVLLSIPLMSDTIPLYLYSLFNEEGKALNRTAFLVSNFLAAWTRAGFIVLIYVLVGEAAAFLFK